MPRSISSATAGSVGGGMSSTQPPPKRAMQLRLDGPSSNLHIDCNSQFNQVAIGGRTTFKIYSIREDKFEEIVNMRGAKSSNLNYSCNDVIWSRLDSDLLATAATNGAIVVWNITRSAGQRQMRLFHEHSRMVNKLNFHPSDASILISGSQDGAVSLIDIRLPDADAAVAKMVVSKESVRDVEWNPNAVNQVAAVSENGQVQLWDTRKLDAPEMSWTAHADHIYSCDWHPEQRRCLATSGRDKCIKIWETAGDVSPSTRKPTLQHEVFSTNAVAKIKWRPFRRYQIASISQISDYSVQVWDVRRPYVSFVSFNEHTDIPTSFLWMSNPHTLLSAGKDNLVCQHLFDDNSIRPYENASPCGMSFNPKGDLIYSFRDGSCQDVIPKYHDNYGSHGSKTGARNSPQLTQSASVTSPSPTKIHTLTKQELFRANVSQLMEIQSCFQGLTSAPPPPVSAASFDQNGGFGEHPQLDDEFHYMTDQRHIKHMAQNYRYQGLPFPQLCDHNAKVAQGCGRTLLAKAWDIVKSLYLTEGEFNTEMCETETAGVVSSQPKPPAGGAEEELNGSESSHQPSTPPPPNGKDIDLESVATTQRPGTIINENSAMHGRHLSTSSKLTGLGKQQSVSGSAIRNRKVSAAGTTITGVTGVTSRDIRDRTGSMETSKTGNTSRHRSKSGKTVTSGRRTMDLEGGGGGGGAEGDELAGGGGGDDDDGAADDENDQTLTEIAAGRTFTSDFAVDFFGDSENSYYFAFNSMVSSSGLIDDCSSGYFSDSLSKVELDYTNLPTEAFEFQRELSDDNTKSGQSGDRDWSEPNPNTQVVVGTTGGGGGGGGVVGSGRHLSGVHGVNGTAVPGGGGSGPEGEINRSGSEEPSTLLQTCVSLVSNAMNTLTINRDLIDDEDSFDPDHIFKETLDQYANMNDPQSAVAFYLVTRLRFNNKNLVDPFTLEQWFIAYIDLLQQYRLYHEAMDMIYLCNLESITEVSRRSTFIRFSCGGCRKPVEKSGLRSCFNRTPKLEKAPKCAVIPNQCSVCHQLVNGLYVWCQGCGHGGHIDCMEQWLAESSTCPAGCGHMCEYL